MANRNNTGRTKKSYNYRPYDTSNSFVKRFTAKVSEILPQPTSWVSRFFSTSPKLNVREREELDEEEEDEEERQPPNKRLCFSSSETNDYFHQNNVNRLSDIDRDSGEISPIAISRIASDEPIPGPSGLHLCHFPISSTPAIRSPPVLSPTADLGDKSQPDQERSSQQQQQQRDDASDESESTSGCSSLVPGIHPRQDPPATPANLQPTIPPSTLGSARRLSLSAAQKTNTSISHNSLNISSSSQPAFDPYVFNNPLNRSGIRKRLLGEDSCFYPGSTTFGGSSARSPVTEAPRVVTVRASPVPQPQQDTIGASALKILRALEQFSTPVMDAKRMPVRKGGRSVARRPQPYEELIVPSMPDLLRVKRREQEIRAAEKAAAVASQTPSTSASSVSQTQYTIGAENAKEKHVGSIKGRNKDVDFGSERIPPITLPTDVKLQLSSLPKLDLECKGKAEQSLLLPQSFAKSQKFKFSEPLEPLSLNKKSETSVSQNVMLAKSLPPQHQMKNPSPNFKLKRKPSSTTSPVTPKSDLNKSPMVTTSLTFPNDLGKNRSISKSLNNDLGCTSCTATQKCTSCMKSQATKKISVTKPADPSWECLKCSSQNFSTDQKCKSCDLKKGEKPSILKGFEGFTKPKDTWDCKECFVSNKNSVDVCPACSTPKPGKPPPANNKSLATTSFSKSSTVKLNDAAVTSTSPSNSLNMLIKTPSGSWECDTCLVKNKKDDLKCVACSTVKPGATLPEEPKPTFTFGIPSTSSSTQSFSVPSGDSKPSQQQFTFGIPNNTPLSNNSVFTFGDQKKLDENKVSTITDTVSSSQTPSTIVNSIKKPEGSWECQTCLVVNKIDATSCVACSTGKPGVVTEKPKSNFTFGIPTAASSSSLTLLNACAPTSSVTTTAPAFTFGNPSSEKDTPKSTSTSNFMAVNDSSKSTSEIKPFGFMKPDQKENDVAKNSLSSNVFPFGSTNCEVIKPSEINEEQEVKPPKKKVSFGNPLISEKSVTSEKNEATFGILVPSKPAESNNSSSNFTFTPFENNIKVPTPSNSFFTFGAAVDGSKPARQITSKPLSYGSSSDNTTVQTTTTGGLGSSLDGGFKLPESENKPFTFMASAQAVAPSSSGFTFNSTSQTGELGSQQSQPKSNSLPFGQPQQSSAAPTNLFSQPQEQKPFVFSGPTQQPALFSLPTAPSQPASSGLAGSTSSGGFNFTIPANTPKFDPNAKPAFNFTGGTTPSFNAAPNSVVSERKMKRGIRRVTANR